MKSDAPRPVIPIPLAQRWHSARVSVLPTVVFGTALVTLAVLWKDHVAAPTMVGQAEAVIANVSSHTTGLVAGLNVQRFQAVKAGDTLGYVITTDPQLLQASLAVIRSELEVLRANFEPIVAQQRNAVDYAQVRLDWMRQRAELAVAKVNFQFAEAGLQRTNELFNLKVVSQSELEVARVGRDALKEQVAELTRLVADGELSFKNLQPTNAPDISKISDEPMRAAIAVQEAQLRLTEAQLAPVVLRAPTDGLISAVYFRSGETALAGAPIVSIASTEPARIIGYLRPPLVEEPQRGMNVQVRTRGLRRESGPAQILLIGAQLEPLPLALQSPLKPAGSELGLAVDISLPANLSIRPGELVDITILNDKN